MDELSEEQKLEKQIAEKRKQATELLVKIRIGASDEVDNEFIKIILEWRELLKQRFDKPV